MASRVKIESEFVNGTQAAEILNVTRRTVYNMVRDGRLRAYRAGHTARDLRIRRSDIEAALVPVGGAA
jgi:excisionase family DNA binding protein